MSNLLEIPMSHFNRIQNPVLESIALIRAKKGEVVVIFDEPETRIYKDYPPMLNVTLTSLIQPTMNEQSYEDKKEFCDSTTSMSEEIELSPYEKEVTP